MKQAKKYEYNGKYYTMQELSIKSNNTYATMYSRIEKRGWDVKRAVETPAQRHAYRRKPIKNGKCVINISEEEKAYWNNLVLDDEYKKKFRNRPIVGTILRT